jgi:hypothetical protein
MPRRAVLWFAAALVRATLLASAPGRAGTALVPAEPDKADDGQAVQPRGAQVRPAGSAGLSAGPAAVPPAQHIRHEDKALRDIYRLPPRRPADQ